MLLSSTLLALVLATPDAVAAPATKVKSGRIIQNTTTNAGDIAVVTSGDGTVADVSAEVRTATGGETVPLVASDAWLHGVATLAALPGTDAVARLTVYDSDSVALATFTGRLGKLGWGEWTPDAKAAVQIRAAEVFPSDAGYDLGFDLSGADTRAVAYADLAVTETTACVSRACTGDVTTTTTTTELALDDLGLVWEGGLSLALEGVSDVTVTATDAAGATLATTQAKVARAWDDGGAGVSALPTDEDPLTSVALHAWNIADGTWHAGPASLTILSDGWILDESLPTYAEVTLTDGEVWEVPANSYQVATITPITFKGNPAKERFHVVANGVKLDAAQARGRRGICQHGACFSLSQGTDGDWTLSATAYAATPEALPAGLAVSLTGAYGVASPTESAYKLTFDEQVAVVFANEVDFAGDPAGLDLSGRVRLRGRQTLLVGKFEGQFGVDADGDLDLAFIGRGGATVRRGDILIGGEPIGIELTADTNGDGVIAAPPVVVLRTTQGGFGNGYMPPSGQGQTQQTQLL